MTFKELQMAVRQHAGEFLCEQIGQECNTKVVKFAHVATEPANAEEVPEVGDLREFYMTFGSILFYHDSDSEEAGKHLAPIADWSELQGDFNDWIEDLGEEERKEILPEWINTALVVGETPASGNFILVPQEGAEAGHVFEFDHDGFEFVHQASCLADYVESLLKPDGPKLTEIAAHMRFIDGDTTIQWWIREMRDNCGRVVQTVA